MGDTKIGSLQRIDGAQPYLGSKTTVEAGESARGTKGLSIKFFDPTETDKALDKGELADATALFCIEAPAAWNKGQSITARLDKVAHAALWANFPENG